MKRAKEFIRKIQSSSKLQESLSDASWSVTAVVEAGAEEGYEFSDDEYRAAYSELAREELAAVVGGVSAAWKKSNELAEEAIGKGALSESL